MWTQGLATAGVWGEYGARMSREARARRASERSSAPRPGAAGSGPSAEGPGVSPRARALARGLALLSLSLLGITVLFMLLPREDSAHASAASDLLFFAVPVSFSLVGGVIAARLPGNRVGWLCLGIGLLWSAQSVAYEVAGWAGGNGMLGTAEWMASASWLWVPAVGLTGSHLALRLPNGALLTPRWRWWSRWLRSPEARR